MTTALGIEKVFEQRKKILSAMIDSIENVPDLETLIGHAWNLVRKAESDEPIELKGEIEKKVSKEDSITPVKEGVKITLVPPKNPKKKGLRKSIVVHGTAYPSIMAACTAYGISDRYQTIAKNIKNGKTPDEVFSKKEETLRVVRRKSQAKARD